MTPISNDVFVTEEEFEGDYGSSNSSDVAFSVEEKEEYGNGTNDFSTDLVQQTSNALELSQAIGDMTSFGDVCIKESSGVHLGKKISFNGTVVIKQLTCTNGDLLDGIGTSIVPSGGVGDSNDDKGGVSGVEFAAAEKTPVNLVENNEGACSRILYWLLVAVLCALVFSLVVALAISLFVSSGGQSVDDSEIPPDESTSTISMIEKHGFVYRNEWLAEKPTGKMDKLKTPVPYVIICHTVSSPCTTRSECSSRVRNIQSYHIDTKKRSDITYNFLVGGDGLSYVGRGWEFVGNHSFSFNNRSIAISFIGNFRNIVPPEPQLHAAQMIIELGVKSGYISLDYKLLGHRQAIPTLSPGEALYDVIKTWPHWSPNP